MASSSSCATSRPTREVRKNTQVIVQQMLKDVGIEVELINHSGDVFFNGYADGWPDRHRPVRHRRVVDEPGLP